MPIGITKGATGKEIAEAAAQVAKRKALPLSLMHKSGLRRPLQI